MLRLYISAGLMLFGVAACAQVSNPDNGQFSCATDGHFVKIHLTGKVSGERNPANFGVDSDESFAYLNDPSVSADFTSYDANTQTLNLDIRTQYAIRFRNGKPVKEKAFPVPGEYVLLFADNLETEPDNTFSLECPVTITQKSLRH